MQLLSHRHHLIIDTAAHTTVAHIGMDMIGKVEDGGTFRKFQ